MIQPPSKIRSDETLGHQINSRRKKRRIANRTDVWKLLIPREDRNSISMDRLHSDWYDDVRDVAVVLQCPQTFYGWLVVTPTSARADGRRVVPDRTKKNPYHANILLSDEFKPREHASRLAGKAWWQPADCKNP